MGRPATAGSDVVVRDIAAPLAPALRVVTTPADEVDLVCRLALATFLAARNGVPADALQCVLDTPAPTTSSTRKEKQDYQAWDLLYRTISALTVLDPACGEGHFLTGMLDVLDQLLETIEYHLGHPRDRWRRRAHILKRNLFGVDVQQAPLDVARVRLRGAIGPPTTSSAEPVPNLARFDALLATDHGAWHLAFPSVDVRGFDLVIGNPPFVRHEAIADPAGKVEPPEYKRRILERTHRRWPDFFGWDKQSQRAAKSLDGRSDLSVPFVLLAASLLANSGALGMIVPAGLAQAGYGTVLREFFERENWEGWLGQTPARGSSIGARVNTALLIIARPNPPVSGKKNFCQIDLSEVTPAGAWAISHRPSQKQPSTTAGALLGGIAGLTELGTICHPRYPIKTGLNAFYYLSTTVRKHFGIEPEFCRPVVKTPRQVVSIALSAADCPLTAFTCDLSEQQLTERQCTGALAYIAWARSQRTSAGRLWPEVPSLRGRRPWYRLPLPVPALLLCPRFFDRRFFFAVPEPGLLEDQTFYGLVTLPGVTVEISLLGAILNSSFTALALETGGRTGLADGVRQYALHDLARLPVLSPRRLSNDIANEVTQVFAHLARRPIMPVAAELEQPDKRALDELIAGAAGVSAGTLQRVRHLLVAAVERRLDRAQQARRGRSALTE